jgi:hypothetical protein
MLRLELLLRVNLHNILQSAFLPRSYPTYHLFITVVNPELNQLALIDKMLNANLFKFF